MLQLDDIKAKDGYPLYWSGDLQPGAYEITNFITEHTDPEEFELETNRHPGYRWHYGGRIGWTALDVCLDKNNWVLLRYLCEYGGNVVTNSRGHSYTPLIATISKLQHNDKCFQVVQWLIKGGAIADLGQTRFFEDNIMSPLGLALKYENYTVARYLIHHGATIYPEIKHGVKLMYQRKEELAVMLMGGVLPVEICHLIASYL